MLYSEFDTYRNLKNKFNYFSNNISYNKVLTPALIKIAYKDKSFLSIGFIGFVKIFFRQVSFSKLGEAFKENKIVSTNCNDRSDTLELISHCFSSLDNYKHLKLTFLDFNYGLYFNFKEVYKVFNFFFSKDKDQFDFKVKLYLAVNTIYFTNALRSLDKVFSKIDLKGKKYVAFNSSYDLESLLILYFKNCGVETFHLSHGLSYIKYKEFQPFDCVNGENLNAKNILVWGESSKEDLINNYNYSIKNKNVTVVGNPKYSFKNIHLKKSFNNGVVFLGRNIYDEGNVNLLKLVGEISIKTGIKFSVKIHPFSNEDEIRKITNKYNMIFLSKDCTVFELLNNDDYDFSICFNTTVYYEAMYFNMFCFRYGVGENECFLGLDDKFQSEMELLDLINKFKSSNSELMSKTVENLLINTLGMGINKYKDILENE
jgi:hypothetical protein